MAYTTPPTFVDDTILTAAQMRALSTAIAELQSAGEQPPQVWLQQQANVTGDTLFNAHMRHAHRYLWWGVKFGAAGDGDDLEVNVYPESTGLAQQIYTNTSPSLETYDEVFDLNTLSPALADGEFYRINMRIKLNGSGDTGTWMYCEERSTAT